ncbi:MAG TPA: hypothetical protein VHO46_05715 [Bacteroidales bacterium]|nr:hypothetical protein [Bacteroidales bacterium]
MGKTINYLREVFLTVFTLLMLFSDLHADSPCGTFVIKITCLTNSDKYLSYYTFYRQYSDSTLVFNPIDESFNIVRRIARNQIDFNKIRNSDSSVYRRVLAINKSLLSNRDISPDLNGYFKLSSLPVTEEILEKNCLDTTSFTNYSIVVDDNMSYSLDSAVFTDNDIIHYGQAVYINPDTIKLILLDSILWCGDNDQVQFLDKKQTRLMSQGSGSHFRVFDSNSGQFNIDFFSFNPEWTKSGILSSLDIEKIDNDFTETGGDNVFKYFSADLKKAIRLNKVIYFVRWSP